MTASSTVQWGHQWRSSKCFILASMAMALFTDEILFAFMVPLLPYIFEQRMGLPVSLIQRVTLFFLAEGALVSVVSSPVIGHIADKASSKKRLLLYSLGLAFVSSVLVAVTTSLIWLFIGRFFQSLASNALWIVGIATLADNIGSEHMGKISGMISTVAAAGTSGGPVIAGILFEIGGYWAAWGGVFAFIVVDIVMRILMIEKPKAKGESSESIDTIPDDPEQAPLLADRDSGSPTKTSPSTTTTTTTKTQEKTGWHFYACAFRHPGFFAGVTSFFSFSVLIASFSTTLPLHVQNVFNWGTFPVGLLFAALEGPGMILSPVFGWLKDRVGSRYPTTIGFLSVVPFLWLLGVPGDERFGWANVGDRGERIYAGCMVMIGCLLCLLNGVGTMEVTLAIDDIEARNPGIFGPNGGYSRAVAMSSMSWTLGLLVGPIISGFLVESAGYYAMNCVLAGLCLLSAVNAACNLSSKSKAERTSEIKSGDETR